MLHTTFNFPESATAVEVGPRFSTEKAFIEADRKVEIINALIGTGI